MADETTNVTQDQADAGSLFDIDPALFDDLGIDANEGEVAEEVPEEQASVETPEEPDTQESGKWSLEEISGKSWEELSAEEDKIPDAFKGTYKSMTRAVQMKMQSIAEERKETKKIREEVEELKRQLREEPPYIREERKRREQEELNKKLEELTPDERREYEVQETNRVLKEQLEAIKKDLEYEKFASFKMSFIGDIKDELISEGLPVKEAKNVYDIWSKAALNNTEYTIQDAVADFKKTKSEPVVTTPEDIDKIVQQKLKEEIDKLRAKSNKATGIKSASTRVPATNNSENKKFSSAEDIFSDISELLKG